MIQKSGIEDHEITSLEHLHLIFVCQQMPQALLQHSSNNKAYAGSRSAKAITKMQAIFSEFLSQQSQCLPSVAIALLWQHNARILPLTQAPVELFFPQAFNIIHQQPIVNICQPFLSCFLLFLSFHFA